MKKIALILVILASIWLSILPEKASAQTVSIGIYPPIIQIQAKPPASVSNSITIQNPGNQPLVLDIAYRQFKPLPNGDIEFTNDKLPEIFQKMQVVDGGHVVNQIKLGPKQKKTLAFHVGITADEKPQDYYFSILFISNDSNVVDSPRSLAVAGIATNVLLSVGPTGPTQGSISDFSVPIFISSGPVPFRVKVENTSTHYISPTGVITIQNIFGQTVGKIDLLPVNVLAQSSRFIPDAQASINSPTATWNEKFLLGPYTARVNVGFSEEGPIYHKTVTFFAFPIELVTGLLISILIVVVIFKKVREKQVQQA